MKNCFRDGAIAGWRAWVCIPLFVAQAACGPQAEVSQWTERPDLSGEWRLNRSQSDDVQAVVQEAVNSATSSRLGKFERFLGNRPNLMAGRAEGVAKMLKTPDRLRIAARESSIELTDGAGNSFKLRTDGNEQVLPGSEGEPLQITTRWEAERLKSDATVGGGARLNATCEMLPGGQQLRITARMQHRLLMAPLVVKVVYDFEAEPTPLAGLRPY